jgi:uncharacterized membrane protein (UPF0127 family)
MNQNKKMIFLWVFLGAIIIFGAAIFATQYLNKQKDSSTSSIPKQITIGNSQLNLLIAQTEEERNQGLSGRTSLAQNEAMLFIFDTIGYYGFWMKDMHFAIDMIWLDQNFKVVSIQPNVTPESYPTVYQPTAPALYVLETNAGFAAQHNIQYGDKLDIK